MMLAVSLGLSAQQSIRSENISSFTSVVMTGNIVAELIPSQTNKIDITLHEVTIDKLKWSSRNGELSVSLSAGRKGEGRADVKIYYADTLSSVTVSGSDLKTQGAIKGIVCRLVANGGAKVTAEFDMLDLDVNIVGNSAAQLSGKGKYLTLRATDKSTVQAGSLMVLSGEIDAATNAEVRVVVDERLIVRGKTGAKIYYKGYPAVVKDYTSKMNSGVMGATLLRVEDF